MAKLTNFKRKILFKLIWLILLIVTFFFAAWGTGVLGYFFQLIN